jgi:CTP:molybdopterin cytidylyltransferase MocA
MSELPHPERKCCRDVTGVILAAGEGKRFGGPKALAALGDENFTSICIRKLRFAGIEEIFVVTGASSDKVEDSVHKSFQQDNFKDIRFISNEDWKSGVTSSIRAGFEHVPGTARAVLLMAVNYPLVKEQTVVTMIDLFLQEPGAESKLMVPIFEGQVGMPVMIGRDLFKEFASFTAEDPLLSLARLVPSKSVCVAIDDQGAFFGITTRDDLIHAMQIMLSYDFEST